MKKIIDEIRKSLRQKKKMKTQLSKSMGRSKSSSKEVYSDTDLPQEMRKISKNNLTSYLKELEKEVQTMPQISRRKEIIKVGEKIHKIEILKNRKINET